MNSHLHPERVRDHFEDNKVCVLLLVLGFISVCVRASLDVIRPNLFRLEGKMNKFSLPTWVS